MYLEELMLHRQANDKANVEKDTGCNMSWNDWRKSKPAPDSILQAHVAHSVRRVILAALSVTPSLVGARLAMKRGIGKILSSYHPKNPLSNIAIAVCMCQELRHIITIFAPR